MVALGQKVPVASEQIGAYRVLRKLGSGQSDMFLAVDGDERRVVLKVIAISTRNQGLLDTRIADEATAYARLSHPNIVKVLDLFSADGRFVVVLEHIDGSTLNVVQAGLRRKGADLADDAAFHVAFCIFSAIADAHAASDQSGRPAPVIHGNINPSSVFLDWTGHVKLGNFKIANVALIQRDSQPSLTWGSYGYLSPEQVRGEQIGPAADVYAAALVLWELLTRRKAIERGALTDVELLGAMASPVIAPLDSIRPELDARVLEIVRSALDPDPAKRSVTAGAMRDALRQAANVAAGATRLAQALKQMRAHVIAVPRPGKESGRPKMGNDAAAEPGGRPAVALPEAKPGLFSSTLRPGAAVHVPPAGGYSVSPPILPRENRADEKRELAGIAPAPVAENTIAPSNNGTASTDPALAAGPLAAEPSAPGPFALGPLAAEPSAPGSFAAGPLATEPSAPAPLAAEPPAAESLAGAPPDTAPHSAASPPPALPLPDLDSGGPSTAAAPRGLKRWRTPQLAAVALVVVGLIGTAAALATRSSPSQSAASAAPSPTISVKEPTPSTNVAVPPGSKATSPPIASTARASAAAAKAPIGVPAAIPAATTMTSGELTFARSAAGHRIFVDGHVVGDGKGELRVACGRHTVRVGSGGALQTLQVPCGGTVAVPTR